MSKDEQDLALKILREEINLTILHRPLILKDLSLLTYWYKKIKSEL